MQLSKSATRSDTDAGRPRKSQHCRDSPPGHSQGRAEQRNPPGLRTSSLSSHCAELKRRPLIPPGLDLLVAAARIVDCRAASDAAPASGAAFVWTSDCSRPKKTGCQCWRPSFIDIVGKRANIEQSLRESRFPEWKDAHSAARSYFFLPFVPSLASRHSNLLMVLPERSVHRLQRTYDLRILRTLTEGPADNPRIIWHDLTHADPLMQWIRSMFLAAAAD